MIWFSFVEENLIHMSGIFKKWKSRQQDDFERCCRMLAEAADDEGGVADFEKVCSVLRTSEVTIDNMMYAAFGMSGEEVLAMHRREKPDDIQ